MLTDGDLHLIRMANDIAANLSTGKSEQEAAEATARHIKKFWAPPMRKKIIELNRQNHSAFADNTLKAIELVEP